MPEEFVRDPDFQTKHYAKKHGVDLDRAKVWVSFSDFFLDTSYEENQIQEFAESVAASPFSIRELGHILFFEVAPVCISNFFWIAGEWALFHQDWLFPKCRKQQKRHPFKPHEDSDKIDFLVNLIWFTPAIEAFNLISRVKQIRKK
jgi:hypothetical protein